MKNAMRELDGAIIRRRFRFGAAGGGRPRGAAAPRNNRAQATAQSEAATRAPTHRTRQQRPSPSATPARQQPVASTGRHSGAASDGVRGARAEGPGQKSAPTKLIAELGTATVTGTESSRSHVYVPGKRSISAIWRQAMNSL